MHRCLQLAEMGFGHVSPNPMVGALLLYNERIIGEGYHKKYGEAHAEVNCFNSVLPDDKKLISEATLYVSLEPCAHFGKTAPCADLIIKHKVSAVVIGCIDSFAEVAGRGIEKLTAAGIDVTVGVLQKECRLLNRRFFTFHENKRPYIILKWAQSRDGKMAALDIAEEKYLKHPNSDRTIISNEFTNRLVHKWRSEEAAILVGTNTALLDDPSLTTRHWPGRNPLRVVIDKNLKLPVNLKLFDEKEKTIVFNNIKQAEATNLLYYKLDANRNILTEITAALYNMQVQSVIVEGGPRVLQSFIGEGLWDEARVVTNTSMVLGKGLASPKINNEILIKEEKFANDIFYIFLNFNN